MKKVQDALQAVLAAKNSLEMMTVAELNILRSGDRDALFAALDYLNSSSQKLNKVVGASNIDSNAEPSVHTTSNNHPTMTIYITDSVGGYELVMPQLTDEMLSLYAAEQRIKAIKLYRNTFGSSLSEAKHACEQHYNAVAERFEGQLGVGHSYGIKAELHD